MFEVEHKLFFPRFVIVRQFRRLGGDLRRSVCSDMTGDFIFLGLSGHSSCLFVKVRKDTVFLERLWYKISSYIVTDFSVSFNKTSSPLFITMRQLRFLNFNRILDKAETKFFLKFNTASSVMIMTAFDMRPVHARCECLHKIDSEDDTLLLVFLKHGYGLAFMHNNTLRWKI